MGGSHESTKMDDGVWSCDDSGGALCRDPGAFAAVPGGHDRQTSRVRFSPIHRLQWCDCVGVVWRPSIGGRSAGRLEVAWTLPSVDPPDDDADYGGSGLRRVALCL